MAVLADWFIGDDKKTFQDSIEVCLLVYQNFRFEKFSKQIHNSVQPDEELCFHLENFYRHFEVIQVTVRRNNEMLDVNIRYHDRTTFSDSFDYDMQLEAWGGAITNINGSTVFMSEHIIIPNGMIIAVQDLKENAFQFSTISPAAELIVDHYKHVRMAF